MKDEIREIIDKIKKCLIAGYDLDIITQEEMGILWNCITNLQEEKEDYKSRNEKAIENIDLVIELIKQQPTEDDTWILNKLNGFKYLLQGEDKDDN